LRNARVVDTTTMRKIVAQLERRWLDGRLLQPVPLVIIVAGPCGSGKTTITQSLAAKLQLPMIEGDEMHTRAARESMRQNVPLNDNDRLSWLAHLRGAVMDRLHTTKAPAVFVTCSALRGIYRDELRSLEAIAGFRISFLMLETDNRNELKSRLAERQGHYMSPAMVDAQVEMLEMPRMEESDMVLIDASRRVEENLDECEDIVREMLG
jgi:carbohydrate kinase (thermoresistant glucokinase family)